MITIEIKEDKEFITLGQLLKIEGLISTGGEAKLYLLNNTVLVDDIKEDRRGRKLYRNTKVELNGNVYNLI